eukprot:scaffold154400_cov12-Tisochrysis_lutea.AAC.1
MLHSDSLIELNRYAVRGNIFWRHAEKLCHMPFLALAIQATESILVICPAGLARRLLLNWNVKHIQKNTSKAAWRREIATSCCGLLVPAISTWHKHDY